MKLNDSSEFLGSKKLFPLLIQMSVPSIIGMIVATLYNVVDTIFVGRGVGTLAIAGLSVAFPIQMIVMASAQMIGIGAASIISRRLGKKEYHKTSSALGTAISSIVIISIIMSALVLAFSHSILRAFGASNSIMPYALEYIQLISWGFPFLSISMAGSNLIRAEGKARLAMLTMLLGMILNIILDPIFIMVLDMGIRGAALATVLSQACSAIWILSLYARNRSLVKIGLNDFRIKWKQLREMVLLGMPNFVQTSGMSILVLIINNTLLFYSGDLAISVYGIINRLLAFIMMPVVGLSQGFQPIAGYNYGAQKYDRVKKSLMITALTATALSSFFYLIVRFFPAGLMGIFTKDMDLIQSGVHSLRIVSLFIFLMGLQIVFSIYFQAVGKGIHALFLGLSRQFLILIPLVLLFPLFWGADGVWMAFPVSDLSSTLIAVIVLRREINHLNDKHSKSLRPSESYS